jgi:hypothetical protein
VPLLRKVLNLLLLLALARLLLEIREQDGEEEIEKDEATDAEERARVAYTVH